MPDDKAYWAQVNRYRRNAKNFGRYPKEIPRGVAKLPNLGPCAEKSDRELELPYCPPEVKRPDVAIKPSIRQLQVGTRGFVSDAEWRFRHWCDRVIDEQGTCDYCESQKNLTAAPIPGTSMEDATMETICVMCPDCVQDNLLLLVVVRLP